MNGSAILEKELFVFVFEFVLLEKNCNLLKFRR